MRLNQPQTSKQLIDLIKISESKIDCPRIEKQVQQIFTKKQLWDLFLLKFKLMHGVKFIQSKENINNVKPLFNYYLRDNEFFNCDNLISDLSKPSFNKGLMVAGAYGIGKTAYFKVFEKIFNDYQSLRFKGFGAKELVSSYEACATPFDRSYMLDNIVRPKLFIDDINSERIASNYGNCDVIEEILFKQNEKNNMAFVTCNHTNPENNIEKTLTDLGVRYGGRMHDRFFEMFNIITFTGKSLRR